MTTATRTRALLAALTAAVAFSSGAVAQGSGEPRYGVCRQQMLDFVTQRLGQTPVRVQIQSYAERMPPRTLLDAGNALVYVEECDGFHSFEIRATEDRCEHLAHYGRSGGGYIRYEGAFDGCSTR